jgi:hypothetical protein
MKVSRPDFTRFSVSRSAALCHAGGLKAALSAVRDVHKSSIARSLSAFDIFEIGRLIGMIELLKVAVAAGKSILPDSISMRVNLFLFMAVGPNVGLGSFLRLQ